MLFNGAHSGFVHDGGKSILHGRSEKIINLTLDTNALVNILLLKPTFKSLRKTDTEVKQDKDTVENNVYYSVSLCKPSKGTSAFL